MNHLKLGLAIAVLTVAGAACGDDASKNNNTNGMTTPNGAPNNTNGTPNNTNGTPNNTNGMPNNNNGTNNPPNNTNNPPEPIDIEVPNCDDMPPPARCAADPSTQVWAPASVVDSFFIEGTADEAICCFDYTDDGDIDNSLGQNLANFGFLGDINTSITDSIAAGSLVLVLEHDGLDDLANDDDFNIHFFIAAHEDETAFAADGFLANSNLVLLDPVSFDEGSHPQALLPDASNTGGAVTAGPGAVKIEIELFDSPLQLTISLARTEVDIDAANSTLDGAGVALSGGQLGGVIKVSDIFVAVNEFAAGACECLGLGATPLVDVDTGMCSPDADAMACETAEEDTCNTVAGACNLFGAVGLFADVDLDGDGLNDSVSIGASYTAVGATINGLVP